MTRVVAGQGVTIIVLGPRYESLNQAALIEFGGLLLDEAAHAQPPRLLLDFSQTAYIGSSFIELLVRAWKRLKQRGGDLMLCGLQPFCEEIMKVSRLDTLWPMYATREEALADVAISIG